MKNEKFEEDIISIPEIFNKLSIVELDGEKILKGELDIIDTTGKPWDTYQIEIKGSDGYPYSFPKLFETAKRRAVNMGNQKISESDYEAALDEIGWTVCEDLNLELRDIVKDSAPLLFDISQLDGACGLPELREAIARRVGQTDLVERVIDVLLWGGALGIAPGSGKATHIYDCGYKLQYLRSLIDRNPDAEVRLHPTISNAITKEQSNSKAFAA